MPDLERYRRKRDEARTPEPFGERDETALPAGAWRRFTVQQHAATRMHWDLRLEIDGVLVSWAVPRGPSLNPKEKRLAVQTEDHPLEYAFFEGNIPAGNYGAGAMILWDTGAYHTVDGVAPLAGLEAGKLDFVLRGHKLHGRFALVRTGKPAPNSWLLLRKGTAPDDTTEVVDALDRSIYSGLTVSELREQISRGRAVAEYIAGIEPVTTNPPPDRGPMLAITAARPFSDPAWAFELKYDGYRLIARKHDDDRVTLRSRNGTDYTDAVPEVRHAIAHLAVDSVTLDGELVALDDDGRPDFEALGQRLADTRRFDRADLHTPLTYLAFDVLDVDGHDLRGHALATRKHALGLIIGDRGPARFVDHVDEHGEALFAAAREAGLEGVMAKRLDSPYRSGRRDDWAKIKHVHDVDVVIVGHSPGRGARASLGALACAFAHDDGLVYAGHVGSGLTDEHVLALRQRLDAHRVAAPPCTEAPRDDTVWCEPLLVAKVRCTSITKSGRLRHPVFAGVRDDKSAHECRLPAFAPPRRRAAASSIVAPHVGHVPNVTDSPQAASATEDVPNDHEAPPTTRANTSTTPEPKRPSQGPHTARLDKVFWPRDGHTKGDLLSYYETMWPWLGPYLRDRPLVVERFPDGVDGKCFFQRRAPDFLPDWIPRLTSGGIEHVVCNDLDTLLYIVGLAAIVLHVEAARFADLDHPDWVVLDLDPKRAPFAQVVFVARHIHRLLDALDTPHAIKTSGRSGVHVLVPLGGRLDHDQARALAEVLARTVHAELPDLTTLVRPIAARGDRVYLDYLQNGAGKLIVAPFSVRAEATPTVSAPLRPGQLTSRLALEQWTITTAPARYRRHGDPMAELLETSADVPRLLDALAVRLARAER